MNKIGNQINNYFNKMKREITNKIGNQNELNYTFEKDNNEIPIIEVFNKNQLLFKAEYNVIGIYNIPLSVWYWGWNIGFIDKKLINDILEVKNFKNILKDKYQEFDPIEAEQFYYLLSNDNFYISNDKIELITKLVMFLTKGVWTLPILLENNTNEMDRIKYILIKKIVQYG